MHAADLISLACAHGIDFIAVAGAANKPDGVAGRRRKRWVEIEPGITDETRKRQLVDAADTAKGKGSRVAKPAKYSHAELGIATTGVAALHWAAIQHTIANDRTVQTIRTLMCGLRYYANKAATQSNWEAMMPGRVERDPMTQRRVPGRPRPAVFYVDPLCMLVIDEISFRPAFTAAPALHAIYLGVEQDTWERVLAERFALLQQRYAGWYGAGLGLVQRRINGDGEAPLSRQNAVEREREAVA